MARALHDGLGARELDVAAKAFRGREVRGADQEESELGLAQRLVELGVAASLHVDRECVFGLLDDVVVQRAVASIGTERAAHELADIRLLPRLPELRAELAIEVAERIADELVGARLAELGLQGLHRRNEDLGLDLGLLDHWNVHGLPPACALRFPNYSANGL